MLLHFGPDEYTEAAMKPFMLDPGDEQVKCFYTKTKTDTQRWPSGTKEAAAQNHFVIPNMD